MPVLDDHWLDAAADRLGDAVGRQQPDRHDHLLPVRAGGHVQHAAQQRRLHRHGHGHRQRHVHHGQREPTPAATCRRRPAPTNGWRSTAATPTTAGPPAPSAASRRRFASPPNLSVVKTADQASITVGRTAGYTVTITNNGRLDGHRRHAERSAAGRHRRTINWRSTPRGRARARVPTRRTSRSSARRAILRPVLVLRQRRRQPGPRPEHRGAHHWH